MAEVNSFETLTGYLSERFDKIEKFVADLPTKSYVNEKIAELEASLTKTPRKLERLVEILKEDGAISDTHYKEIKGLPAF
jgi:hypothetical protein